MVQVFSFCGYSQCFRILVEIAYYERSGSWFNETPMQQRMPVGAHTMFCLSQNIRMMHVAFRWGKGAVYRDTGPLRASGLSFHTNEEIHYLCQRLG